MEHQETLEFHLNTNSKKIKRGFSLFFLLCPLFLFANINIDKNIEANKTVVFPLNLKKDSFIKGAYSVSSEIEKIELLDKNKNFLRRLDRPRQNQFAFYFLSKEKKDFFIKLVNKEKKVKLNLKIEKILPARYEEEKSLEILSPTLKKLRGKLSNKIAVEEFWKNIKEKGTPLIEPLEGDDYLVTFLYKGAKHNVRLFGGPVADHVLLDKLDGSDIWFKSFKVKKGVRLSYQLAPDVPNIRGTIREKRVAILSTAQVDSLNKKPYLFEGKQDLDKYSMHSTFEILDDSFIDWTKKQNNPKGKVFNTKIKSDILKDERNISIYTPFDYDYKKEHQLLFIFDGIAYQQKVPSPRILDNLIAKKKILPTIAIFIDNPTRQARATQLPPNEKFADFMAKELLPFVKTQVKVNHNPKNTILTGSSYGGLASMYVAFKYPELFGNVLSQSGSFWWGEAKDGQAEWLTREIAKSETKDINIYLNAGLYETGYFSIDILESNRHLKTVLEARNYKNVVYEEFHTSHDYYAWRTNLAFGLISLSKLKNIK